MRRVRSIKNDKGKPRTDLMNPNTLLQCSEVLGFGAKKYSARNNRGLAYSRFYAAALRHLYKFWSGIDNDEETGKSHIIHAITGLMLLHDVYLQNDKEKDDRE